MYLKKSTNDKRTFVVESGSKNLVSYAIEVLKCLKNSKESFSMNTLTRKILFFRNFLAREVRRWNKRVHIADDEISIQ